MGRVTGEITYNLADRGRTAVGSSRDWDMQSAVRVINSPATQEMVEKGDMLGYLEHLPRTLFNTCRPVMGGLVGGKYVTIDHAVRTLKLKADSDGTVHHVAEFLDTEPGEVAERADRLRVGGFSSFMTAKPRTFPYVALGFFGYDYVTEPNYDENRGYARAVLDSVQGEDADEAIMVLDSIAAFSSRQSREASQLIRSMLGHVDQMTEAMAALREENDALIDRLARQSMGAAPVPVMDSVPGARTFRQACLDQFRHVNTADLAVFAPARDHGADRPLSPEESLRRSRRNVWSAR